MMPVVRGAHSTARQVVVYTVVLTLLTLMPGLLGTFGAVYVGAAVILGGVFCLLAWRLWREQTPATAGLLFHYSLLYLALLFAAVAIDAVFR
jgi:protoheme IX farnesyltransferase